LPARYGSIDAVRSRSRSIKAISIEKQQAECISPATPGQIEGTAFSLEAMANLFESYLTSVSVNMPGSLLPSARLSWGMDGSLMVNAPRTMRCPAFQGTIEQFLQERHKNRADHYRFPTDMKSRLTELGMQSHYEAVIEYAAAFAAMQVLEAEASASGSAGN
jgi:hypothetical protein